MIQPVGASRVLDSLATLAGVGTRALGRTSRASATQTAVAPPQPAQPAGRRADRVELSPRAQQAAGQAAPRTANDAQRTASNAPAQQTAASPAGSTDELTEEQKQQVRELKQRDREVRAHEQAHKAAGGQHTGAISFQYTTGPDGRRYVTSGEVPIDTSPVKGDPQATINKMQQVRKAALAPAQPSSADRQVAAKARREELRAQGELAEMRNNTDANATSTNSVEAGASEARAAVQSSAVSSAYSNADTTSTEPSQLLDLLA